MDEYGVSSKSGHGVFPVNSMQAVRNILGGHYSIAMVMNIFTRHYCLGSDSGTRVSEGTLP